MRTTLPDEDRHLVEHHEHLLEVLQLLISDGPLQILSSRRFRGAALAVHAF